MTHPERELTFRGLVLGALITVIFTAANVYLGLKVGLTFASSIPAAVISMAVLRLAGGTILENNMVQTQASAAGTLASVIFVLPALVMVGHWQGFAFWQTSLICAAGGVLGVLFTVPLRRAMVTGSDLPYPEGMAAAEILKAGHADTGLQAPGEPGAGDIAAGAALSAAISFLASGLLVLADQISVFFAAGPAVFRLATGFSLALLGAGYLIGLAAGLAMLLGACLAWEVIVPILTTLAPTPAGTTNGAYATFVWAHQVRFMGAGLIGVAAVFTLGQLLGPTITGVREAMARGLSETPALVPDTDRDLAPGVIAAIFILACLVTGLVLGNFVQTTALADAIGVWPMAIIGTVFTVVFGFAVAAACGYMAGLVGSSASPISGIAILATLACAMLIAELIGGGHAPGALRDAGIAFTLFVVTAVLATATISNDNLQDLKTGQLVGATPWKQQVALLAGTLVGALVIPPVLNLLYNAYGFGTALPRLGMDAAAALAAPQATLMAAIATGIFGGHLDWRAIAIGAAMGATLIALDQVLTRRGAAARVPPLAVGIGLYLPPSVGVTLAVGAILGFFIQSRLSGRADAGRAERRGVLIASGFIVGESLVGVAMAAIIGATGLAAPLAMVGTSFAPYAAWAGLATFGAACAWFARRVLTDA